MVYSLRVNDEHGTAWYTLWMTGAPTNGYATLCAADTSIAQMGAGVNALGAGARG